MSTETDRIRDDFVNLWGQMAPFWGVSPATGRVYGWLLTQPEPCDAESIVEGLGMSRGAVSMACRELRDWGLVNPERTPGSRRVSYRPETDMEKAIRNIVQTRKRREWDPILASTREWILELEADGGRDAEVFRERLEVIESLIGMADHMAEQFLRGGIVQKLGLKMLVSKANRVSKGNRRKQSQSA